MTILHFLSQNRLQNHYGKHPQEHHKQIYIFFQNLKPWNTVIEEMRSFSVGTIRKQ